MRYVDDNWPPGYAPDMAGPASLLWPLGATSSGYTNPCGGLGWRTLADGEIEVEGIGRPLAQGAFAKYVEQSWRNFQNEILAASKKRNVPASWILAIISVETGLWSSSAASQAAAHSSCCVGPAAVMLSNYKLGGYTSSQDLYDPAKNIDTGAAIMRLAMDQGLDLPGVCARYNSGGLCCPSSPAVAATQGGRAHNDFLLCSANVAGVSYPMMAIQANNYAIASGLVPSSGLGMKVIGIAVAVAGVGIAAAIMFAPRATLARYGLVD